jgi:serine/threonine-protein phosphatase 2B catalytic subunit
LKRDPQEAGARLSRWQLGRAAGAVSRHGALAAAVRRLGRTLTDPQVQAPAMYLPTDEQFWSKNDKTKPDIAFLKNHFYREGRLTEEQALYILQK